MVLAREQMLGVRNAADVAIKQLWMDETIIKSFVDKVSAGVILSKKLPLNDEVNDLEKKLVESDGDSQSKGNPHSICDIMSEMNEIKRRENNVLIFGVFEDADAKSVVTGIARKLITYFDINNLVSRLGKPIQSKQRSIKAVLSSYNDALKMLKGNRILNTTKQFEKIYLRSDSTIKQREYYTALKKE
ncbi:hypothetical protein HHI36_010597 [Cryptolaemus montrouzieri]|uniref:Uncharacterized protein n=1 Tax=Cryptolaemus montrouzieri TaxID=559131 RepID=A0ABD2MJ46_9CUCU